MRTLAGMRRVVVVVLLACAAWDAAGITPAQADGDESFGGVSFSDAQRGWAVFGTRCDSARTLRPRSGDGRRRPRVAIACQPPRVRGRAGDVHAHGAPHRRERRVRHGGADDGDDEIGRRTWTRVACPRPRHSSPSPAGSSPSRARGSGARGHATSCSAARPSGRDELCPACAASATRRRASGRLSSEPVRISTPSATGTRRAAPERPTRVSRSRAAQDAPGSLRGDPCRVPGGNEVRTLAKSRPPGRYVAVLCTVRRGGRTSTCPRATPAAPSPRLRSPTPSAVEIALGSGRQHRNHEHLLADE